MPITQGSPWWTELALRDDPNARLRLPMPKLKGLGLVQVYMKTHDTSSQTGVCGTAYHSGPLSNALFTFIFSYLSTNVCLLCLKDFFKHRTIYVSRNMQETFPNGKAELITRTVWSLIPTTKCSEFPCWCHLKIKNHLLLCQNVTKYRAIHEKVKVNSTESIGKHLMIFMLW